MGPCCVEGCEVTSEETFYFEFPTSRLLRRKWLELIPIQGKLPLGTVVCSRHFHAEDYESVRGKVRLKRKVVPSLLLEQQQPSQLLEQQQPSQLLEQQQASQLLEQQPSQLLEQQQPSQLVEQQQPSQLVEQQQASQLLEQQQASLLLEQQQPSQLLEQQQPSQLLEQQQPNLVLEQEQQQQKPTSPSEIPLPKSPPPSLTAPSSPKSPKSPKSPVSPPSPPKEIDAGDSTTVSVPSPVDAEKMIDDIQKRIVGSINMLMKTQNGVIGDDQTLGKSPPAPPLVPPLDHKEDIEDMITNYHIKNKVPNPALLADLVPPAPLARLGSQPGHMLPVEFEVPQKDEPIEIEDVKEAEPVFIEVSVDRDTNTAGAGSGDCLMVLESVQVDVDPSTLLLAHDEEYYREEEIKEHKKEDPISLLTSSDEDDVILQEPHIDTVEVSDETDEDDVPLVKLVKKKPGLSKKKLLKKKTKLKKPKQNVEKIVWGMYDFYCVQCHFSTKNSTEYNKHISEHSTVLHVCPICSYTSASKSMFARHTRIHKVEKKFKCHLCDYRARHKMSLIYHLKKHNCDLLNSKDFKCKRCSFKSDNKYKVLEHLSSCRETDKKHVCGKCDYATKKKSDLKRHCLRIHPDNCEQFMIN